MTSKYSDQEFVGMRFGRLVVLRKTASLNGHTRWECQCDCGKTVTAYGTKLTCGHTGSCGAAGCKIGTTHGLSKKSKAYIRWKSMMARCYNPRNESYARYGSRGICVSERWHTFENFLADMGEPAKGCVLDRVNFDADYSPSNCRWATFKQSTQNRSNTVWLGASRVKEISEIYGIPEGRVYNRIHHGWSLKDIIQHPEPIKHGYSRGGVLNPNAFAAAAKR